MNILVQEIRNATDNKVQQSDLWILFSELQSMPHNWLDLCDAVRSYVNKNDISPDILLVLNEIQEQFTEKYLEEIDSVQDIAA